MILLTKYLYSVGDHFWYFWRYRMFFGDHRNFKSGSEQCKICRAPHLRKGRILWIMFLMCAYQDIHATGNLLYYAVSTLGGGNHTGFPPQRFFGMNLIWWDFIMKFWGGEQKYICSSEILYRQCQPPSTHSRGLWKITNFVNYAKISKIFGNSINLSEIRVFRKIILAIKKL